MHRFLEIWDNNVLFIVFPNGHKPASGLELQEQDLRYVSDYIVAENTFKEFPHFSMPVDGNLYNKIAMLNNNATYKFDVERNDDGSAKLNEEGEEYYSSNPLDFYSQDDSDDFNSICWACDDDLFSNSAIKDRRIEKNIRYKRN